MVHAGTYWYILVRSDTVTEVRVNQTAHFIGSRSVSGCPPAPTSTSLSRTLGLVLWHSFLPHGSLLHSQTTQAWLATAKVPHTGSQVFTSYTLLPRLPSEAAESAQPMGNPQPLCLLNLRGIVGVELPARNKGMRGALPTMWSTGAT
jgi:hypothetical protein